MMSNTNEPERTGTRMKRGDALSITPSNATAPAGGCKQRKIWPKAMAEPTAIPLAKGDVPIKTTQRTAEIAPSRFPKIRFLG